MRRTGGNWTRHVLLYYGTIKYISMTDSKERKGIAVRFQLTNRNNLQQLQCIFRVQQAVDTCLLQQFYIVAIFTLLKN